MEQIKELTPINVHVKKDWLLDCTRVTADFFGTVDEGQLDKASALIKNFFGIHVDAGQLGPATPERVIFNDPATIVLWSDGTKTVTKCKGCDDYEPLFGVLACAMRKVGRNKVSIDAWEGVLAFLADSLADADECRMLADALNATADALDCGDTMDAIVCHEMRHGEGKGEELPQEPLPLGDDGSPDEQHERTRSLLRELLDRGEL